VVITILVGCFSWNGGLDLSGGIIVLERDWHLCHTYHSFFGMMVFHDKMNGVNIIAMLVSIWGFVSYVYHHYLEDKKARKASA
jgi:hypothetical protein